MIRWYKKEGDLVEYNDLLCDIETEVSLESVDIRNVKESLRLIHSTITLFVCRRQDFTFGMVNEEEVDAIMGEIAVAENSDPIADGALLCTLYHPKDSSQGGPGGLSP